MFNKIDKLIYLLEIQNYSSAQYLLYDLNVTTDIKFNYIIDDIKNKDTLKCLINWKNYFNR